MFVCTFRLPSDIQQDPNVGKHDKNSRGFTDVLMGRVHGVTDNIGQVEAQMLWSVCDFQCCVVTEKIGHQLWSRNYKIKVILPLQ